MNAITKIRRKYFQALTGLKYDDIEIPIFSDIVNPNVEAPIIKGAETYIVLQDQQINDAPIQTYCAYDLSSAITIRIVTKFGQTGSKINCEDIAYLVDSIIRDGRNGNKIDMKDVKLVNAHTTVEYSQTNTAYQYILTYSNLIEYE